MTLEEFREKIRKEIVPLAVKYIGTIIFFEDYEKSNVHHKMIELVCSYAKGFPYDEDDDIQLHMFMHKKSRAVTDFLDETIGFVHNVGYRDRTETEIKALGEDLVDKLCRLTSKLFPDGNAVLVFKEGEIKPGPLKAPARGLLSQ